MYKSFKYQINAKQETILKAENWLRLCCDLYNAALSNRIYAYKMQRVSLTCFTQQLELKDIRKQWIEYKDISSNTLIQVLERLDIAYNLFYKRIKLGQRPGFPRYKSVKRYDSFTLKNAGWHIDGRYLWIHKVGRFKMNLSRPIKGTIKTITIKRSPTGKWYASFLCDDVPEVKLESNDKVVGLDMGITSYLTDSEGNHIENPHWLKQSQTDLRRKQRRLSRRVKGSKRRAKARLIVAKAHDKVSNGRLDFQHKLANNYIKNYGKIVIEDLAIANMVKNRHLAKSISDCAWGQFFQLLKYKAEEAGREIIESYRFKPTSKACSSCGEVNHKLKLSDRSWVCTKCGTLHDRDENAAKNIKASGFGQNLQTLTYSTS